MKLNKNINEFDVIFIVVAILMLIIFAVKQ